MPMIPSVDLIARKRTNTWSPNVISLTGDFGAKAGQDITSGFNRAITELQGAGGGTILLNVHGYYPVQGDANVGPDGFRSGILIPALSTDSAQPFLQTNRIEIILTRGAILEPAADSLILLRCVSQFVSISGFQASNLASHTGCWAVGFVPANLATTSTLTFNNFNELDNFSIDGFDEGIVLQAGPVVGGPASECYYNNITRGQINNTKRGILIRDGVALSEGANRNRFAFIRIGTGVNTGLEVQSGDTGHVIACDFEGCASGTSPNTTPTAIKIATAGAVSGWGNIGWVFVDCVGEANTRDIDCAQADSAFVECAFDYDTKCLFTQVPNLVTGNPYSPNAYHWANDKTGFTRHKTAVDLGVGDFFDPYSPTNVPAVAGDFHNKASGPVIRSKSDGAGAPEFRLDTNTAYAFYSSYAVGAAQWYFGAAATGLAHASVIGPDQATVWWQFRGDAGNHFLPGANGTQNIGSAVKQVSTIYLVNAPVVSSDLKLKDVRGPLKDAEITAGRKIAERICIYKLLADGDDAKLHIGVVAQEVMAIFYECGLDPFAYKVVERQTWEGNPEDRTEDGELYTVCYQELALFVAAAQEERLRRLESQAG